MPATFQKTITFDNTPIPEYQLSHMIVFNEKFIAENSEKDMGSIIDLVIKQDWLTLKKVNPIFHKIQNLNKTS